MVFMAKSKEANGDRETRLPVAHRRILGLTVNTLGRNITWSLARRTARHGVFPGVNPVVAWLMQLSESTQSELSRLVGIEQPTMAVTLKRMERDGLISRSPDPTHGRRTTVRLTARGRKLSQLMSKAAAEVETLAMQGLSAREVDEFFRVANLMTQNLNTERYGRK
jgi:DNA-binding MarR family transcriptional regulator